MTIDYQKAEEVLSRRPKRSGPWLRTCDVCGDEFDGSLFKMTRDEPGRLRKTNVSVVVTKRCSAECATEAQKRGAARAARRRRAATARLGT